MSQQLLQCLAREQERLQTWSKLLFEKLSLEILVLKLLVKVAKSFLVSH